MHQIARIKTWRRLKDQNLHVTTCSTAMTDWNHFRNGKKFILRVREQVCLELWKSAVKKMACALLCHGLGPVLRDRFHWAGLDSCYMIISNRHIFIEWELRPISIVFVFFLHLVHFFIQHESSYCGLFPSILFRSVLPFRLSLT